jgi:hypothetical protein
MGRNPKVIFLLKKRPLAKKPEYQTNRGGCMKAKKMRRKHPGFDDRIIIKEKGELLRAVA